MNKENSQKGAEEAHAEAAGRFGEGEGVLIEYAQYAHILKKTPFFLMQSINVDQSSWEIPSKTKPREISPSFSR